MIRIHEVSRSTIGPFPRRHHVTIPCYMAYPEDKGFQVRQRQVAKTANYFPCVCQSFPLSVRVCQYGSHWKDSREISNWRLSLKSVKNPIFCHKRIQISGMLHEKLGTTF
jgi:hypothetical protein